MSHTYATLPVTPSTFEEIFKKLKEAGYDHALEEGLIDMHGIARVLETKETEAGRGDQKGKDAR